MHDIHTTGVHYVTNAVEDKPHNSGGILIIAFAANGNGTGIYSVASATNPHMFVVNYVSSTDTWTYNTPVLG